jgi:hypothetical protein
MTSSLRSVLLTAAFLAFVASPAQAGLIDFTDADAWEDAEGLDGFTSLTTYDGLKITVTSNAPGFLLTFNADDAHGSCAGASGLACDGDGLGVSDDEVTYDPDGLGVDGTERLYVYFSDAVTGLPVEVTITGIGFLDLFGQNALTGDTSAETAMWTYLPVFVDGSLTGTETNGTLGYKTIAQNQAGVNSLFFYSVDPAAENSDFALASLSFRREQPLDPVPEPATLMLTAAGLAAAFRARRRRA